MNLSTYQPIPDVQGNFSLSQSLTEIENQMGRELTPGEFEELRQRILDLATEASLRSEEDEDQSPLEALVHDVLDQHPGWSLDQLKQGVQTRWAQDHGSPQGFGENTEPSPA